MSRRSDRSLGFAFVAYAFAIITTTANLPTPLYPLYQRQLGFGALMVTVIFAVYSAGVLGALVLFGRASDRVGRRPTLLVGVACAATSTLLFLTEGGLAALLIGRVLSGLSVGLFAGTATVALAEIAKQSEAATVTATAVNIGGVGCGPLLAGLLASYAPSPLRLPFIVGLGLLALSFAGVCLVPETVDVHRGAWPHPQMPHISRAARAAFIPAAVAAFAAFAVSGLLSAVAPVFLVEVLHATSPALAGAIVGSIYFTAMFAQIGASVRRSVRALSNGCAVLIIGLAAVALALVIASLASFIVGGVICGAGIGLCFQAGLDSVTSRLRAKERAATTSAFFVVVYGGLSIPVILVGVAAEPLGLRTAGLAFTAVVVALAGAALLALASLSRADALHGGRRSLVAVGGSEQ